MGAPVWALHAASRRDLPDVDKLQRACYDAHLHERPDVLGSILDRGLSLVARHADTGALVGYALVHGACGPEAPAGLNAVPSAGPTGRGDLRHAFIHDVAVLPSARRLGVASALVERVLEESTRSGARTIVLVSVQGSAPFWGRHGFRPTGLQPAVLATYGPGATHMSRIGGHQS